MRKIKGSDAGQLYAMKVLKKATLKGKVLATSTSTFLVIFVLLLSDGIQKFITIANVLEKKGAKNMLPTQCESIKTEQWWFLPAYFLHFLSVTSRTLLGMY